MARSKQLGRVHGWSTHSILWLSQHPIECQAHTYLFFHSYSAYYRTCKCLSFQERNSDHIIIVVMDEIGNASLASYIICKSPVDESYCISCLVKPHHFLPLIIPSPGHLQVWLFVHRAQQQKKLREPIQHSLHHTMQWNSGNNAGGQCSRPIARDMSEKRPRFLSFCPLCTLFSRKLNPKLEKILDSKT